MTSMPISLFSHEDLQHTVFSLCSLPISLMENVLESLLMHSLTLALHFLVKKMYHLPTHKYV